MWHSRSGSTARLRDAFLEGAAEGAAADPEAPVRVRSLGVLDAGPDDVAAAAGVALLSPTNFGYMAGLTKDFLERIFYPCLEAAVVRPWALVVKGDTDLSGGVSSIERIVEAGMHWKRIAPPLQVLGPIGQEHLDAAWELGATFAAGLGAGLY